MTRRESEVERQERKQIVEAWETEVERREWRPRAEAWQTEVERQNRKRTLRGKKGKPRE